MAKEFVPHEVAVVILVHPLEPNRARRHSLLKRRSLGNQVFAGAEQVACAADELDMEVADGLGLADAPLAVSLQSRQRSSGLVPLADRNAAVGISIEGHEEAVPRIVKMHA